jgi:hypothetical protein
LEILMKITRNDTIEFAALYQERFSVSLSKEQARSSKLELLVKQVELVYQPITIEQLNEERQINSLPAIDFETANRV